MLGLFGILGPTLWYFLLPGIGVGRTYGMATHWAFQVHVVDFE